MQPVAITRRAYLTLLGGAAVTWPCAVLAQPPAKVSRLGALSGGRPRLDVSPGRARASLRGLAQHGYTLGWNLASSAGAPKGTATACRSLSTN